MSVRGHCCRVTNVSEGALLQVRSSRQLVLGENRVGDRLCLELGGRQGSLQQDEGYTTTSSPSLS